MTTEKAQIQDKSQQAKPTPDTHLSASIWAAEAQKVKDAKTTNPSTAGENSTRPASAKPQAEAVATPKTPVEAQPQSFLGSALTGLKDFSEGVFHGAVENPVNGVVQLADHMTGAKLPELHLTNDADDNTTAGKIGSFLGTTADVVGLTLATGGLGAGAGIAATATRLAITGAVIGGVFTPTDNNSKTFFEDRLKNAAVSGVAFAAMGAASAGLDSLAANAAVPAARSMLTNITLGAVSGAAGGAAHAEANAVVNEGRALPSAQSFVSDVGTYALLGGAMGAAGTLVERAVNPPETFGDGDNQVRIYSDSRGNIVRAERSGSDSHYSATLNSNGEWTSTPRGGMLSLGDSAPSIDSITKTPDGKVSITSEAADSMSTFGKGTYSLTHPDYDAEVARYDAEQAEIARTADRVVNDATGSQTYDYTGRFKGFANGNDSAYLNYDASNNISTVQLKAPGQSIYMNRQSDGSYNVTLGKSAYTFKGTVTPVATEAGGPTNDLQFTGPNGSFRFTATSSADFANALRESSTLRPGATGLPVLKTNEAGETTITGSTAYNRAVVNNEEVAAGQTVTVKPGDRVQLKEDVGDRYAIWQTKNVPWTTAADGTQQLGAATLKPNSTADLSY